MAVKKTTGAAKTTAKTVKAEPEKTAARTVQAESAKAIETKKDTTKKLETKAGVLVDTPKEKAEEA